MTVPQPPERQHPLRRIAARVGGALRTFWLILGVWVALLLLVEIGFRIANAGDQPFDADAGPNALARFRTEPWAEQYLKDMAASPLHWSPYVYWRHERGFKGKYITTDSAGVRITPQTAVGPRLAKVFFFGGSLMWGYYQRDDHTIAAETARRLQALTGNRGHIEVTNFGETGYVFTQDVINLILQLRRGERPDVVVFYHGLNDVGAMLQSGVAGIPQNEQKRINSFEMGRVLDKTGTGTRLRRDLRAIALLTGLQARQLLVFQKLAALGQRKGAPRIPSADSATRAILRIYAENVRVVEGLSKEFGFTPIYVWHADLASTKKTLTPREAELMKTITGDPMFSRMREIRLALPPLIDSALTTIPLPHGRFVDLTGLFQGDTREIYEDRLGHNTEQGVPVIVDGIWPALTSALAGKHIVGVPRP